MASKTVLWKTSGGDAMRFIAIGTYHPRLQGEDRVTGWADCNPREVPSALFALCVSLLEILDEAGLLTSQAVVDAGIVVDAD